MTSESNYSFHSWLCTKIDTHTVEPSISGFYHKCNFSVSSSHAIRGQYTNCNLDMRKKCPEVERGGAAQGKNNAAHNTGRKVLPMPPLHETSQEFVPASKSTEQTQECITCLRTDLEMETGAVKNEGRGISRRTSNSVYKQYVNVYHQNGC